MENNNSNHIKYSASYSYSPIPNIPDYTEYPYPSTLIGNIQENNNNSPPSWESLVADMDRLNLSLPRHHQTVGPVTSCSVPRARLQCPARGQHGNFSLPQDLVTDQEYRNMFAPRPEHAYLRHLLNDGSHVWTRPSLDRVRPTRPVPQSPSSSSRSRSNNRNRSAQLHPGYMGNGYVNQNGSGRVWPVYIGRSGSSSSGGGGSFGLGLGPGLDYNKPLEKYKGSIKSLAKDKDWAIVLKQKIDDGAEEDIELIFEELKDDVAGLMVNYFGNIVVQKLFKVCRQEQIGHMLYSLLRANFRFHEICCDEHGCMAMEKLLENLRTHDLRCSVISALSGNVLNLSKDQNAHKVVKYCIQNFPENVDVLINEIATECFEIATHKSGCCVLQDCLSRANGETMERLMREIGPNAPFLSEHLYGNYVVQYILNMKNPSSTRYLLSSLAGHYVTLSMNKCGSNVVEKCFITSREDEAKGVIEEIMESDNFLMVCQDPFGNYVVQKAIDVVGLRMRDREFFGRLEDHIVRLFPYLHSHPYGNRVVSKLKQHRTRRF